MERADLRKKNRDDVAGHIRKKEHASRGCGERHQQRPAVPCQTLHGPRHTTKLQKGMQTQMVKPVSGDINVDVIDGPPIVTQRPEQWGFKGGWGPDLATEDSDG